MDSAQHIVFIDNEFDQIRSIGAPYGRSSSTCGYCSPPGHRSVESSFHKVAGLAASRLTSEVYQKMIDRGWRRAGLWCYKPDLRISCCPHYTIKLDALAFKPSKSQRKIINRWNRYVLKGREGEMMEPQTTPKKQKSADKGHTFDLIESVHSAERMFHSEERPAHQFETILEHSSFTEEKYELYVRYQRDIHHDYENTPGGFKRFLVTSPLQPERIPYPSVPPAHLPKHFGSYHQLYRFDGKLVALAVLDILPSCVSSVYFIYDKAFEDFSFGKLSALRECSLAKEIHEAGIPDMKYLYMGFYIHSCQKMRYKAEYAPSYLLDPESYDWFPLELCKPLLEQNRYGCFSNPRHSIQGDPPNNLLETKPPRIVDEYLLDNIRVFVRTPASSITKFIVPVHRTRLWEYEGIREEFEACAEGLGPDLLREVVFSLDS